MSKIPSVLRTIGWIVFILMWVPFALAIFNIYKSSEDSTGLILLYIGAGIALMFVFFFFLIGASIMSWMLKKMVASRGKKVTAVIVKTTYMAGEGDKSRKSDIIRFDMEVNHEGEAIIASTEVKARNFDASKYPAGTKVSAVYDHSTRTIAMLNKNNYVVEHI